MTEALVIDANPMVSAMLGGAAREVLFSDKFVFLSTQYTMFEVARFLPLAAEKLHISEIDLYREFQLLPVVACQPGTYDSYVAEAERLIDGRDLKDVPILALTLSLQRPIWTEDRDFDGIQGISIRRTSDLLAEIAVR